MEDETTYTPPPITGYRTLTQTEVDLMNEIKAVGETILAVVVKVQQHTGADQRWASIAQTDLQKGLMSLVRAVAKPTSF